MIDRLSIGRTAGRRAIGADDGDDSELDKLRRNSLDASSAAHLHSASFNLRQQRQQQQQRDSDTENSRSESRSHSQSSRPHRTVSATRPPASPSNSHSRSSVTSNSGRGSAYSISNGASGRFLQRALTRAKSAFGSSPGECFHSGCISLSEV